MNQTESPSFLRGVFLILKLVIMPDKKHKNCIAIITIPKNLNVGIDEDLEYRLECPFTRYNTAAENMEWFRRKIRKIYYTFVETSVHVDFDHEVIGYEEK